MSSNLHTYIRVFSPRMLKDVERNDESESSSNQKTLMGLAVETRSVSSGIRKLHNYPRQVLGSDVLKMPASLSFSLSFHSWIWVKNFEDCGRKKPRKSFTARRAGQ